eukprot:1320973-Prymnesium_polylepis.2
MRPTRRSTASRRRWRPTGTRRPSSWHSRPPTRQRRRPRGSTTSSPASTSLTRPGRSCART